MSEITKPMSRSLSGYYARKAKFITMCENCEFAVAVEVHHVDRDPFNNELSNLKALCKVCHRAKHSDGPSSAEIARHLSKYREKHQDDVSDGDWQTKRMFTPEEYLRTLWRLGLTQTAGGRFLGVSERTSRRYVRGEADVPPAQVLLLRAMLELKASPVVPQKKPGQS